MSSHSNNNYPKLHNAMWPGLVGKGSPGAEPCIDLDTMLDLTARAEVDGVKFNGVDIFLFEPHINIDISDGDLEKIADKIRGKGLVVGSVVAPIWPPTGGGPAMGSDEDRRKFVEQVRKGCRIARKLRELGARPEGVVRIDSASSVEDWSKDPDGNSKRIAETFRQACDVAADYGERLAAEGEICWGGMHSWKRMVQLLEMVDRPKVIGFQADMAHTLLYVLGYNAPEDSILPLNWDWSDPGKLDEAYKTLTRALRPWTIDFHVAQNDATVKGSGTHDKTGHHCLPNDTNGKLDISRYAGFWLRDENGTVTKAIRHLCWDGCMFSNETMMKPETWNDILSAMITVRDQHGWSENGAPQVEPAVEAPEAEAPVPAVAPTAEPSRVEPPAPAAQPARKKPVKKAKAKAKAAKKPVKKGAGKPAGKKAALKVKAKRPLAKATLRKPLKAKAAKAAKKPTRPLPKTKTKKAARR